jgi:uncharacterized protein (UPF0261 family)
MNDMAKKTVLIISTLDTKGEETYYLRDKIASLGLTPLLMDISMRGEGPTCADITPDQVAAAGGSNIEEIRASKERSRITNITIAGASRLAGERFIEGKLDGVIGIGGSTGSLMATEVMRALPFGIPKLMISSTAAHPLYRHGRHRPVSFGHRDIRPLRPLEERDGPGRPCHGRDGPGDCHIA